MDKSVTPAGGFTGIILLTIIIGLSVLLFIACGPEELATIPQGGKMKITSPAFQEGEAIPARYSCDGANISPELNWSGATEGTQSFALIADDPDAPTGSFTHWVIFNIPADSRGLAEAVPNEPQLASGTLQGKNDFGNIGYGGPCPPRGVLHHYHFTLYGLDQPLDLAAGTTKKQVLNAMQGHILASVELIGTFER